MSDDNSPEPTPVPQIRSSLASPQVLAAMITGLAALIVALVPMFMNNATSAPIPTPTPPPTSTPMPTTVLTFTPVPAAVVEPTVTAFPMPTEITLVPSIPDTPQPEAGSTNVLMLYDDASFTIYNQDERTLSIMDVRFRSSSGRWDGEAWGPSLARSFPADHCLRLRDATKGQRQPPAVCGSNLYGLQLVGPQALFWLNTDQFEVMLNGEVITTCRTDEESCVVYIPG